MDFSNLKSKLLLTLVLSREMNNFNCCNYVHSLWDGVLSGKSISRRTRQAGGVRFRSRVAYCEVSFVFGAQGRGQVFFGCSFESIWLAGSEYIACGVCC